MGKRRAKRKRPRARPDRSSHDHLPSNFVRVVEMGERLFAALRAGADIEDEIMKRREEIARRLAPFDAVHALGHVVMREMALNPETYSESEHPGAAHVVELATAVLLARPSRAGERAVTPMIDATTVGPVCELLREAVFLEGLRRYDTAGALGDDPFGGARGRAATHHLTMRAPGWHWQESALLLDLFGAEQIASRLQVQLGFDAAAAVGCAEALPKLLSRRVSGFGAQALAERRDQALAWASVVLRDGLPAEEPVRDRYLTVLWAMNHIGEAMLFTADELAEAAGVGPTEAAAVAAALSTPFGQTFGLFEGAEVVRARPYLDAGNGRFLCTVPSNDLWALRRVFESALAEGEKYAQHRGRWLERRAGNMLGDALAPDELHFSVKLFPAGGGDELGEIDALLRFGDTILAIESKGATLKPSARRGAESLIEHLKRHLTKAAEQGSLARRSLTGEIDVELRVDGRPLDLGARIREVHPVVVTLDDLSPVAPVLWELAGTAVLPDDVTIPWVVTLHELEHVCATVQWPQQLVHFLRRRSQLNDRADRVATEELDWWMLYLDTSLYFAEEPQPDAPARYLSLTDPLDAWMLHKHGVRTTPAPKPRQRLSQPTEQFLNQLATERPPGWIAAGCSLLDVGSESHDCVFRELRAARARARQRVRVQRGRLRFDEIPGALLICWVVVPDEGAAVLAPHLEEYACEHLEKDRVQRVLGIGHIASTSRPYDALLVVESSVWKPGSRHG